MQFARLMVAGRSLGLVADLVSSFAVSAERRARKVGSLPQQIERKIARAAQLALVGTGQITLSDGTVKRPYKLKPRHALLAVHAAHTISVFVLETCDERVSKVSGEL